MIKSNIFQLTKVRNGNDSNNYRLNTSIEGLYKFGESFRENDDIVYKISPDNFVINLTDLSNGQPIENDNFEIYVYIDGADLKSWLNINGQDIYSDYVFKSIGNDEYDWYFRIQQFYTDFYNDVFSSQATADNSSYEIIKTGFEKLTTPTAIYIQTIYGGATPDKTILLQAGTKEDSLKLEIEPAYGIFAAIREAGLQFDSNGVGITNGNFFVTNSNGEKVLNFDKNTNSLSVTGNIIATNGIFHGRIEAEEGYFNGQITADSGEIGGFAINSYTLSTDGIILESAHDEIGSSINIGGIKLSGDGYIKVGNLKLIDPNKSDDRIILDLKVEDESYFQLTDEGYIEGNNWSIKKEAGNNYVTARFGKLVAEDGEFYGTIHAVDGEFSGQITASIINTSTLNTVNFVTENTRSMGGSFIFKPTFEILGIKDKDNNILEFTLQENAASYFQIENSNNDIIVAISGVDVRFGKISSVDNNKIQIYFENSDYNILRASSALDNYQTLTLFGVGNTDVLIGINSDDTAAGDILPPRSLVMETFTNLNSSASGVGDINYSLNLLLGDLSIIKYKEGTNFNYVNGYGLYADNVLLHGSLITENGSNGYAGVHTAKDLSFNYEVWGGSRTNIYDGEKIIFWGGANSLDDNDIQKSPFIVTDKGSIFASRGEFKGAVIANSIITDAIIETPVIYGTGKNPSLKIYDTNTSEGGISFYKKVGGIDDQSGEKNDVLTLNINNTGFSHYYGSNSTKFISFSENDANIYFLGTSITTGTTTLSSQLIKDQIGTNTPAEITIHGDAGGTGGKIELKYGTHGVSINSTNIWNYGGQVVNEGEVIIQSDTKNLDYRIHNGYYCLFVS